MKRIQKVQAPKWMTPEEENRLMYALSGEKNEFKSARDHAIVYAMRYAGLRVEKVSDLKIGHIDMRLGNVTVADGKGGKYRVLPMHPELKRMLKKWLVFRQSSEKQIHQESEYLLVSERAGKLTTRGIEFMLEVFRN